MTTAYRDNRSQNIFTGGLETLMLDALEACCSVEFLEEDGGSYLKFDRDRAKDIIDEYR